MTTTPSTRHLVKEELGKVAQFCIYALFEWILIALLFINGSIAFIATQFAKCCELRIPCLLCSRIDHVYAERDEDFHYNDTMCELHRRDISYLAYCHNHKKLSDIRKMCEACLLSFATEKESDGHTYKSLVGILHKDLECFMEDDNQIQLSLGRNTDGVLQIERSTIHKCSCCGMHLKLKNVAKGKIHNQIDPAPLPPARPPVELPHLQDLEEDQTTFEESKTNLPLPGDGEESPHFTRGNKLFGMPESGGATSTSPRWASGKAFAKRSALERVEFGSESEGSTANESEESILHRLKRQVRLDRKSLITLYMELDEERNASAVAANNAMAMITRLQADKAAVQMEALQYQRMMEEQAEYDQEALQETQKIIRDMEHELDAYRHKFGLLESFGIGKCDIVGPDPEVDYLDLRSQTPSIDSPDSQKLDNLGGLEMTPKAPLVMESSNSERSSPLSIESRNDQVINGSGQSLQDESRNEEVIAYNLDGSGHLQDESRKDEVIATDNSDGSGDLQDNVDGSGEDESRNDEVVTDNVDGSGDVQEESALSTVLDNSLQVFEGERSEILDRIKNLADQIQLEADDAADRSSSKSSSSSSSDSDKSTKKETGKAPNEAVIAKELSFLNERVHNLEAHSGFLKDAVKTLQKDGDGGHGVELLGDISENLQKLRHLMSMSVEQGVEDPHRGVVNPENESRDVNPESDGSM